MFDSKELAGKALLRAVEIKNARRRKKRSAFTLGSAACICVGALLVFINYSNPDTQISKEDTQTRYIAEPYVPLARPPTEDAEICSECGLEIEEDHCCYEYENEYKQYEFCERE